MSYTHECMYVCKYICIYRILQIVHGGKFSRMQNQILLAGFTVDCQARSSLGRPAQPNPKLYGYRQTTVKHARARV